MSWGQPGLANEQNRKVGGGQSAAPGPFRQRTLRTFLEVTQIGRWDARWTESFGLYRAKAVSGGRQSRIL
jgi:hypothetical protein